MTAKQRFEEAGWECVYLKGLKLIHYERTKEFRSSIITFDLINECFYCSEDYEPMDVNMKTLKLINYQCEELGWL